MEIFSEWTEDTRKLKRKEKKSTKETEIVKDEWAGSFTKFTLQSGNALEFQKKVREMETDEAHLLVRI